LNTAAGDYTKMRREYFQNLTVKDILDDMRSEGFIDNGEGVTDEMVRNM
jgi:hypothetical protein